MSTSAAAPPAPRARDLRRGPVAAVAVGILLLAWLYAVLVPAGLPYDEPSHWQNVVHVADDGSLPVVGDPDVSYEAVQGPLAYVVDAGILVVLETVGLDRDAAFVGVRMVQGLWLVGLFLVLMALVRRVLPAVGARGAMTSGAVVAGVPILAAVGSSVQNDVPALVLALTALLVFLNDRERSSTRAAAGTGALLGLAFLAKASVWPLGVVLLGVVLVRREWARLAWFVGAGLLVSGWWVVRNLVLYDSLTGNEAVSQAGTDFPPVGLSPSTVLDMARSSVTFLWSPVEYWRNVINTPAVVDVLLLTTTLAVLGLGAWLLRHERSIELGVVVAVAVLSVLAWAAINTLVSNASFRLAYLCLPAWAVLIGAVVSRWPPARWVLVGLVVALNAWSLVALDHASFTAMDL